MENHRSRLKILNAIATNTSVTFMTNVGVAEAVQADDKNHVLTTRPLRDWYAWFRAHESWFPRLVRTAAAAYSDNSRIGLLIMVLTLIYFSLQTDRFMTFVTSPPTLDAGPASHFLAIGLAVTLVTFVIWYLRTHVSPWARAAELVREAYDTTGSFEVDKARYMQQSGRYNGSRFLLPFIASGPASDWVGRRLGIHEMITALLACELLLWIDVWIGWYRVPIVKQFTHLVQRLTYPIPPNEHHVRAAQLALTELARKAETGTLDSSS